MKREYDFSKGVRGKFYHPQAELMAPIYLEPEIAEFVKNLALAKNVEVNQIVNMLLRKDKELIEYGIQINQPGRLGQSLIDPTSK